MSTAPSPAERTARLPAALDRRFEAVVAGWDGTAVPDDNGDASRARRAIERLCALGMDVYVVSGSDVGDVDGRLRARPRGPGRLTLCVNHGPDVFRVGENGVERPPATSDAKRLDIGATDQADATRWIFDELWRRGISPRLVLSVGDELGSLLSVANDGGAAVVSVAPEPTGAPAGVVHLGGGPDTFLALLEDQLARRERGDVPALAEDDGWTLAVDGLDPELERTHEALFTLADGRIGTNGSPAWSHPLAAPRVLPAGVYDGEGPSTELLAAPVWHILAAELPAEAKLRRRLDLRTGLLRQTLATPQGEAAALRLSSLARPGTVALRATGPPAVVAGGNSLRAAPGTTVEQGRTDGTIFMLVPASRGGVAVAASEEAAPGHVERLAAYIPDPEVLPDAEAAVAAVADARRAGFEAILGEHRAAWAERWEDADVVLHGDQDLQLAVRFALFHLMGSVAAAGEAAVGARGLAGPGYRGHVFWDTDVFVLPFLAATHPPAARAILEYRIRRLPAALRAPSAWPARALRGSRRATALT